jgi:3-oxoacyl-[acyl-carrier-protein] synthase-3
MSSKSAHIRSIGTYLPSKILTNRDLEGLVNTSDEWILTRTGMQERHIAASDEFTSDMGVKASLIALERGSVDPLQIDMIIVATLSPDYIFPSTAALIQKSLGAQNAACFDIQAACSGLIYGLAVAKSFIESNMAKNILFVASEKLSSFIDYQDRNTCVLFGDGAFACVVTAEEKGLKIGSVDLGTDGQLAELLYLPAGGVREPASVESIEQRKHFLKMDGKEVFKHAVRRMEVSALKAIELANLKLSDITYLVPHQANIRIIDAVAKRVEINDDRVVKVVHKYGNTSASSIGLALEELFINQKILDQNHLLLVAFGAGLTWGSVVLTAKGDFKNG